MDTITSKHRSWNMSRIRSKNTSPEIVFRRHLYSHGIRYRLHSEKIPGRPDIILSKNKIAYFVNGCFWHQHLGCKRSSIPKSNREYWIPKLEKNIRRQKEVFSDLQLLGWKSLIIWECEVKDSSKIKDKTEELLRMIK